MKKIFDLSWLNKNILGFGIASLLSDMGHEMAIAILPAFLITLVGPASAPKLLGIISGASDAAASFFKIFSGMLSDRLQLRKPFIVIGYAVEGIFVGILGFAHSWKVILWDKTIAWLGKGMREPARDAFIVESIDPQFYGRAFGFHRAMDTIGAIIGPLLGFLLVSFVSLKTLFLLTLLPSLGSMLAIIFLTTEEKKNPVKKTFELTALGQLKAMPRSFLYFAFVMLIFGCGNFNKMLIMLHAQNMLRMGNNFVTTTGFVLLLYTLFSIARSIAEYIIGFLSDFFGRIYLLAFVGFGLFGVVCLLMMLPFKALSFYILIFVLAGISTAAVTALEKAYAADLLPEQIRGTGYGFLQMIDGIGDLISSIIVGFLWSAISPLLGFTYAALLSFISLVLLLFFFAPRVRTV
ncbi:MAG: MFS transporter [Candidatus Babeliaceae bacterium]